MDDHTNARRSAQQNGGRARSESLTAARRSQIASDAAQSRWNRRMGRVNRSNHEGRQMSTDVIAATELLKNELDAEAKRRFRSVEPAVSNRDFPRAHAIIDEIERIQVKIDGIQVLLEDDEETALESAQGGHPAKVSRRSSAPRQRGVSGRTRARQPSNGSRPSYLDVKLPADHKIEIIGECKAREGSKTRAVFDFLHKDMVVRDAIKGAARATDQAEPTVRANLQRMADKGTLRFVP